LEQAAPLTSAEGVRAIVHSGLLALAYLHQGQPQLAQHAAYHTARLIGNTPPAIIGTFDAYVAIAEVYLELWQGLALSPAPAPPTRAGLKRQCWGACRALGRFTRVFPMGQARYWLYLGRYAWQCGQRQRAQIAWSRGLAAAERLGMPYEQGLIHAAI